MIHILRWICIFGTCAFLWWLYQPDCNICRRHKPVEFN